MLRDRFLTAPARGTPLISLQETTKAGTKKSDTKKGITSTQHEGEKVLFKSSYILDPLPMAPIAAVNADLTIAVSLSGSEAGGRYEPTDTEPWASTEWLTRMWRSTTALFESNRSVALPDETASDDELVDASKEDVVPRLGSFEVMNRTIDIAQAALARHTLAAYPPDVLIVVPRTACRSLEFYRAAEVIDIGRELAAAVLDELEKPTAES